MSRRESAYRRAGVDIDAQERALARVRKIARSTFTRGVVSEIGGFGGLFQPDLEGMEEPLLVASADGLGTKMLVARRAGDYSTVGRDLVNHCVNDILVQGAVPLFFMDYLAAGALAPAQVVEIVEGVAEGCRDSGCALLGGETAEMPDVYRPGDYELAGFIVGVVDRRRLLGRHRVRAGDVLVGLSSSGLHTNGYSLARRVFFDRLGLGPGDRIPGASARQTVAELLLAPHLSYQRCLAGLLDHPDLHAIAHITGGGITDNLPRVLPGGTRAEVRVGSWEIPELFYLLQEHGEVDTEEMFRVFNMGVGMILVVAAGGLRQLLAELRARGQRPFPLGTVQEGGSGVVYDLGSRAVEGDG